MLIVSYINCNTELSLDITYGGTTLYFSILVMLLKKVAIRDLKQSRKEMLTRVSLLNIAKLVSYG